MTLTSRKKRGEELVAKCQARLKDDKYTAAIDIITDILLATAQTHAEATQLLHAAEVEFRNAAESEAFVSEG